MQIRVFSNETHNRFLNFPATPTHNTSFLFSNYDLTGVGWLNSDVRRQLTMVSPIHYVGANHFRPNLTIPQSINFLDANNQIISRSIDSQLAILNENNTETDLLLGKLSSAISQSDGIAFHPYLNLPSGSFTGNDLITLGSDGPANTGPRGGSGRAFGEFTAGNIMDEVDLFTEDFSPTRMLGWLYENSAGGDNDSFLEVGDSGSPAFVDNNGVAAIVGVNSLISTTSNGDTVNFATLLPHYADTINSIMAQDGYHLTKANPGSTTLDLQRTPPNDIIRAGHDFTVLLEVDNVRTRGLFASNQTADNIKLENTFSTSVLVPSTTGNGWFDESTDATTRARRAFITNDSSAAYNMVINIPTPGTTVQEVTYWADQFTAVSESFDIEVIDSFISWGSGLADATPSGDDDLDNISNLLEYAFGGDANSTSQTLPNSTTKLLPVYDGNQLTYHRRLDRVQKALTYEVTTSTTLDGQWVDATSHITASTITSIGNGLESVTLQLTSPDALRFFRVEVTLNE